MADLFTQMVMHYLYKGGCENLDVDQNDVLELMAAANFFQLDGLLRFCESRCSTLVDLDNIVSMYIHAKVRPSPLSRCLASALFAYPRVCINRLIGDCCPFLFQ